MTRRQTVNTTGIRGTGGVDASQLWLVVECSHIGCPEMLRVDEASLVAAKTAGFLLGGRCGHRNALTWVETGVQMKYCRVCERLQTLESFHRHKPSGRSFRTGRQLECKTCKNELINPALNPLRTPDQLRESSQRCRRIPISWPPTRGRIDTRAVFGKFQNKCFRCEKQLDVNARGSYALDHTLPAKFLWPYGTLTATLLCTTCNGNKAEQWPATFYADLKLRTLPV